MLRLLFFLSAQDVTCKKNCWKTALNAKRILKQALTWKVTNGLGITTKKIRSLEQTVVWEELSNLCIKQSLMQNAWLLC